MLGGVITGIDAGWNFYGWDFSLKSLYPELFSSVAFPETFDMAIYADGSNRFAFLASSGGQSSSAGFLLTSVEKVVANTVPEPASVALVGAGLLGIAALRKRPARHR